ncbi:MAG TPA: sugar ABC transporter permease [Chloroflexota bacterium]|nr:sugar ABC transporter permease [Chloroflexota bacterium]
MAASRRPNVGTFAIGAWLTGDTLAALARRKMVLGYLFVLPTLLGIVVFTVVPVIGSFGLSFFRWSVIEPAQFTGLANYQQFIHDQRTLHSFVTTAEFVVIAVTLQIVLSLLLAISTQQVKALGLRYFFRSAFFLPLLTSAASISIVLAYMYDQDFGVINYYLGFLGIPRVPWLNAPQWALVAIILTYVWEQIGFTFIVFTGGLGSISRDVLDAADVDGAAGWKRLWLITLPMLSPTMLFAAVVGVIGALQLFAEPYVMTQGGPGDATRTVVMIIYEAAFQNLQIGYASAVAVFLFLVILLVTAAQFALSKLWVFYQ